MMNMREARLATSSGEKEVTMTGEEMTEGGTGNMKGLIFNQIFQQKTLVFTIINVGGKDVSCKGSQCPR